MKLYVARHGEAEPQRTTDEARALTDAGRDAVLSLWQTLARRGVHLSCILCSPYVRARQTAELIAGVLGRSVDAECPLLVPEGQPLDILDWLREQEVPDGTLLVSHMPLVGHLVGKLGGAGECCRVPMGVGAVACLDMEVLAIGGGRLQWLHSPEDGL